MISVFKNSADADMAIGDLTAIGIFKKDISILSKEPLDMRYTDRENSNTIPAITDLTDLGVSRIEAELYESRLDSGNILVIVKINDLGKTDQIQTVLKNNRGWEINYFSTKKQKPFKFNSLNV